MASEAVACMEEARQRLAREGSEEHRRGVFQTLKCGVSHGGGQKRPKNLYNTPREAAVLGYLNIQEPFKRMAGFASSVMCHWAPALYRHYADTLGLLYDHYPDLQRIFPCSCIFTATTYNLGPRTVCFKHRDFGNLPFGLCAITALGSFNPQRGGHFVMWECRLVIEFPPGSTILALSAVVSHANTSIAAHEKRYSFTQYSAGGLFRWVEHGFQKSTDFWKSLSASRRREEEEKMAKHWAFGLSLLPTFRSKKPEGA